MTVQTVALWKYELQPGETVLALPVGAVPLTVAAQGDGVFLWALVAPDSPTERRVFLTLGTGHRAHPSEVRASRYVGTAFLGALVFHVFETVLLP